MDENGHNRPPATQIDAARKAFKLKHGDPSNPRPELGGIKEVCAELGGVNPATVYRLIARGELSPPIKIGGRSFWDLRRIRARIQRMLDEAAA